MSTIERKEYQETKIMRTVSPSRNYRSSTQNLAEFDHNLDYLLEDLQNSVSRPGSSLGTHRTIDSTRTNSLTRHKSAAPVTEYSSDDAYNYTSPDGNKHVTGYKKESYSYKTSGAPPEKARMQNSINQLDTLLDDLQQVKNSSFLEKESYNNTGKDPEFQTNSSRRAVQRELHYGDTPRSSSRTREYSSEGTYGDIRSVRPISPSPSSRTSTLTKQTKVANMHSYPLEVVETTTPDINPEILAHLDPNLHPPGNTKVTTTIKTYTYEIPGSGGYNTNLEDSVDITDKYVYSPNQSASTPSKSFVYQKLENNSSENTINYPPPEPAGIRNRFYKESTVTDKVTNYNQPPYQKPAPPGGHTLVKETVTTRNYQPGYSPDLPPSNQTYIYNETTTTRNVNDPPPRPDTYVIKEIHDRNTTNTVTHPRDYPPPTTPQTIHYIKEVHDTNRTNVQHPYPNGYPPTDKTIVYRHETHNTNNYGPTGKPRPADVDTFDPNHPPYGRKPKDPVNIEYRYKSESTTSNNYKAGYPPRDETQTLLPNRFPTENHPDGPPKRLDDLMANIGHEPPNSPYNAGFTAHEQELQHQKKIDTLKRQHEEVEEKQQPVQKSKNVSGPPVYYPPGHELFAKKEEAAGWRAEGGYERAAGKYEYEAASKSKSKSSSGAAIVPVCLPLCCGLPCTIL